MADDRKLRVLWATDGSENSLNALPLLRQMVLPVTEKLTVLSVAPHALISGARPNPVFLTKVTQATKRKAMLAAHEAAEREATALDPEVDTDAISKWGHPIEQILRTANQVKADLIVMAAKGHSNLHLIFLGSVSQGVAHHTTRPLLIARPATEAVHKVLLGYHGTSSAKRAFAFLNRLALPPDTEIVLMTVIEPFTLPEGMPPGYRQQAVAETHRINERRHKDAEKALAGLAQQLRASGRKVSTEVTAGPAAAVLDEAAHRHQAGLIVLGSRRPKPESHFLMGVTAERIMRHSHVSVLMVR
jgi:nucleotide-binding universal stress UspA family protein